MALRFRPIRSQAAAPGSRFSSVRGEFRPKREAAAGTRRSVAVWPGSCSFRLAPETAWPATLPSRESQKRKRSPGGHTRSVTATLGPSRFSQPHTLIPAGPEIAKRSVGQGSDGIIADLDARRWGSRQRESSRERPYSLRRRTDVETFTQDHRR